MPGPPRAPRDFKEILELIWWRLDRALDEEAIYWSAIAGAIDAVRSGTTCLFDHHASPSHISGSLGVVAEALEKIGLRGVLCYEVTDRGGDHERDAGVEENGSFLSRLAAEQERSAANRTSSLYRGMVGAHASFTLSDESLDACADVVREFDAGFHIHVAEDRCDVEDARSKYKSGIVERLSRHGLLNGRSILAHCTHLEDAGIDLARGAGVWFAHNPRSNMNNRVGYAPVDRFGNQVVLGTDGIGADMFEEARFAFFKSRDGGSGLGADDWLRVLSNNQRLASLQFGVEIGTLLPGSAADLVVLDYESPTPLTAENLAWHFAFGISSATVESVMVNGKFLMRNRRFAYDDLELYRRAQEAAKKLWARMTQG
jgi:putative selenium metabolism protein SsnA